MEKTDGDLGALLVPASMVAAALLAAALRDLHSGAAIPDLGGLALVGGVIAASVGLASRSRSTSRLGPGLLGRARRARRRDLGPLRRHRGEGARVRLGSRLGSGIFLPSEEHLLALGPTGSGKSSALAIPAILEWPGAVVVTDPKGELLERTAGPRAQLGSTAVFAPLMAPGDRWDPVRAISSSEDALRTAGLLLGKPPEREPFWHDLALQLLHGLLVEAATTEMTLHQLLGLLQQVPAEEVALEMTHGTARTLVQGALSGGDRTAMGVVATLVSRLGIYGTEQVAESTRGCTFDPRAIADGGLGTLYCVVTPHDAPLLRGLVSALLAACWRAVFARPPKVPVLFVLDEFAQLTALPELPALVQLGRSQGIRILLLGQDLASIGALYGADTTSAVWANCRTKLLLPGISEVELLDRTSRLAGSATLERAGAEALAPHPLLPPDEIRRMGPGRALVLRGSDQPALIRQRPWYRDRRLRQLCADARATPTMPRPVRGRPLVARARPVVGPLGWVASGEERP